MGVSTSEWGRAGRVSHLTTLVLQVLPVLPGPAELTPPPGPSQTLHVSSLNNSYPWLFT